MKQPTPALLVVTGPDSYISPDWYETDDQVPTWNYVAVHLTGSAQLLPDEALDDVLARQSEAYETRLLPKPVWTMDKVTPDTLARMKRMIVPARMQITDLQSTWKLGQNKAQADRMAAADQAEAAGFGSETSALSAMMRRPPDPAT